MITFERNAVATKLITVFFDGQFGGHIEQLARNYGPHGARLRHTYWAGKVNGVDFRELTLTSIKGKIRDHFKVA